MIRLFLGLVAFLSTSFGGLLYSLSNDTSLDEATFENESLQLEETAASAEMPETAPSLAESKPAPETPATDKEPDEPAPAPTPKPAESPAPETIESSGLSLQSRLLRFGFRVPPAPRTIDTVVLHSSYNALGGDVYSVDKTISEYEQYGVGAHYLIDRAGTVLRLVEETNIAYHAGSSKMPDGRKNVNDFSIGIEIIATEDSGYTDKQYSAVNALIADIEGRYKIKSIVGHGDIAPGRKTDPWKFDWKKLK
jgi:hypothetical protein